MKPENFEPQFWQQKGHNRFWVYKEYIIFVKSTEQMLFAVEIISDEMNESKTQSSWMWFVIEIRTPSRMVFLNNFFSILWIGSSVAFWSQEINLIRMFSWILYVEDMKHFIPYSVFYCLSKLRFCGDNMIAGFKIVTTLFDTKTLSLAVVWLKNIQFSTLYYGGMYWLIDRKIK